MSDVLVFWVIFLEERSLRSPFTTYYYFEGQVHYTRLPQDYAEDIEL